MKGILTIVGRPNVGKSTLFNRLVGSRKALVMDTPGVTRDRNYEEADWYGRSFIVVDTGGFDPSAAEGMLPAMRAQAQLAVDEADAILFILDGRDGLTQRSVRYTSENQTTNLRCRKQDRFQKAGRRRVGVSRFGSGHAFSNQR
jgi:small GTP-binding protein